jgi:hypothetical protein
MGASCHSWHKRIINNPAKKHVASESIVMNAKGSSDVRMIIQDGKYAGLNPNNWWVGLPNSFWPVQIPSQPERFPFK